MGQLFMSRGALIAALLLLLCETYSARRVIHRFHANKTNLHFEDLHAALPPDAAHLRRALFSSVAVKPEDHLVSSLPGLNPKEQDFNHYAGHIPVDPARGGHLFYWLFEAKKGAANRPLVIWLNGGPGCSSMDGLWLELGPLRLNEDQTVSVNPHSWHRTANMLFVDQPVGTGLSYTMSKDGYAKNDETVNAHFYTFLVKFFEIYSHYVVASPEQTAGSATDSGNIGPAGGAASAAGAASIPTTIPIFFTGESHAGHYIPSMVHHILRRNADTADPPSLLMNVQGMALGNPWIDPMNQYNPAEFAHGLGILSAGQTQKLAEQENKCRQLLRQGRLNNHLCLSLLDTVIDASSIGSAAKVLMYDTRKYVYSARAFPPGHEALEKYLNRHDVQVAIHARSSKASPKSNGNIKYVECADPPYNALSHQDGKGVVGELAEILTQHPKIRVLFFAGQYDLICNHRNLEKALDALPWAGQSGWQSAVPGVWILDKRPVGYHRVHANLQYLVVLDSGHMVPMDQPEVSLSMIRAFIENKPLRSGDSKLGVVSSGEGGSDSSLQRDKDKEDALDKGVVCPISSTPAYSSQLVRSLQAIATEQRIEEDSEQKHKEKERGEKEEFSRNLQQMNSQTTPASTAPRTSPLAHITHNTHIAARSAAVGAHKDTGIVFPAIVQGAAAGENAIHLRIKAQHWNRHTNTRSLPSTSPYFILIQPGRRRLDISWQWFATLSHSTAAHADVLVEGLSAGIDYRFQIDVDASPANVPSVDVETAVTAREIELRALPHAARRILILRPGCFHNQSLPCCGHGECVPVPLSGPASLPMNNTPSHKQARSQAAVCRCESGYVGPQCDHYLIQGTQLVHGHESERDVVLCPARPAVPAVTSAMRFDFRRLPRVSPSLSVTESGKLAADVRERRVRRGVVGDEDSSISTIPGETLKLGENSANVADTLLTFTQGCSGHCCVYVELHLDLTRNIALSHFDNDSTSSVTSSQFRALGSSSISPALDEDVFQEIERALTEEISEALRAHRPAMSAIKLAISPLSSESENDSKSKNNKKDSLLPVYISLCGDVQNVGEETLQLARFVTSAARRGESARVSSALHPTALRVVSHAHEVAELRSMLSSAQHARSSSRDEMRGFSSVQSDLSGHLFGMSWKMVVALCVVVCLAAYVYANWCGRLVLKESVGFVLGKTRRHN